MKVELQSVSPAGIERRSMEVISREMGPHSFTEEQLPVVKRCIHASADFDYVKNLRFTGNAVSAGIAALRAGCTVVTDTQMAYAGINKRVLEGFRGGAVCFMADPDVAAEASRRGITRAAVAMERAAGLAGPVVLVVGNAPTALVRACELMSEGKFAPELVIGVPVGFVNVVESKELLWSMPGEHIVAMGRKGGSNIAAAVCNALLYMASGKEER